MTMTIILYKCTDDRRKVTKVLTDGVTKTLALRGDVDIMTPEWIIDGDASFYNGFNYVYCPDLGRYYYVHKEYRTGGLLVLKGEIDVLMTYAQSIRNLTAIVERQEYIFNPYFNDELMPVQTNGYVKVSNVGSVTSTTPTIYLTCIGAVEDESE